ncbi:hypothetical protein [Mangrovihabitans endophyticus]|uniref:YbaB/EbfC DNA-binding family protein n=1 Tax=Mangrovihabitans endophyticus TaxID=1751298 RepID=A0A8J3C3F1_9ACTN|nr:hypothetical protein [Mangrovihabitans endophyticus]GGL11877.1 hypothetical protein GCM10012284_53260 [Mangrovihabitans endophyticus]
MTTMPPDPAPPPQPQHTADLARLARELAAAAPEQASGHDNTGQAQVVLGPDGVPAEIRIHPGWQQHLGPERLGPAVMDAHADALQQAAIRWAGTLDATGWRQRAGPADTIDADNAAGGPAPPDLPHGHARDTSELAEDVLTQLHAAQEPRAATSTQAQGHDDEHHVTLTLGPAGLAACSIDAHWADHRTGDTITRALATALSQAASARADRPDPGARLDALVGDALATLTALTNDPPPDGERP